MSLLHFFVTENPFHDSTAKTNNHARIEPKITKKKKKKKKDRDFQIPLRYNSLTARGGEVSPLLGVRMTIETLSKKVNLTH